MPSWAQFHEVTRFELRRRLTQRAPYAVTAGLFALWLLGLLKLRHDPQLWGAAGEVHFNAPLVLQLFLSVQGVLALLVVPLFVADPLRLDHDCGASHWIYSLPLNRGALYWGRFAGSFLALFLALLVASTALLIAPPLAVALGRVEPERVVAIDWAGFIQATGSLLLPNALCASALSYAAVSLTRNKAAATLTCLTLLLGAIVANQIRSFHPSTTWLRLLNPSGFHAVHDLAITWPLWQRDAQVVPLAGDFLLNRIAWLAAAGGLFGYAYWRFDPIDPLPRAKRSLPPALFDWLTLARFELSVVARDPAVLVVASASLLWVLLNNLSFVTLSELSPWATSASMLRGRRSLWMITLLFIPYLCSSLVYRERTHGVDPLIDSSPVPSHRLLGAKVLAASAVVSVFPCVSTLGGLLTQWTTAGASVQWHPYWIDSIGVYWPTLLRLTWVSMAISVASGHRNLGFALGVLAQLPSVFLKETAGLHSPLALYAYCPAVDYDPLVGFAGYGSMLAASALYWLSLGALCLLLAASRWPRGQGMAHFKLRKLSPRFACAVLAIALSAATGASVVQAEHAASQATQPHALSPEVASRYERQFGTEAMHQSLAVHHLDVDVQWRPQQDALRYTATYRIRNAGDRVLQDWNIFLPEGLSIETARLEERPIELKAVDTSLGVWRLTSVHGLAPGQSAQLSFDARLQRLGPPAPDAPSSLSASGAFLFSDWLPRLNYDSTRQLHGALERLRMGLPSQDLQKPPQARWVPNDRSTDATSATWTMRITAPSGYTVVAPGVLASAANETPSAVFSSARPDRLDLAFAAYPYSFRTERLLHLSGSTTPEPLAVTLFLDQPHRPLIAAITESLQRTAQWLTTTFGPYPYRQLRLAVAPRDLGEVLPAANTLYIPSHLLDVNPDSDRVAQRLDYLFARALAQHYWLNALGPKQVSGAKVFSEAIPEYAAIACVEHWHGEQAAQSLEAIARRRFEFFQAASGQTRFRLSHSAEAMVKHLGPLVLRRLERTVSPDVLLPTLRSFLHHAGPSPSLADLFAFARQKLSPGDAEQLIAHLDQPQL